MAVQHGLQGLGNLGQFAEGWHQQGACSECIRLVDVQCRRPRSGHLDGAGRRRNGHLLARRRQQFPGRRVARGQPGGPLKAGGGLAVALGLGQPQRALAQLQQVGHLCRHRSDPSALSPTTKPAQHEASSESRETTAPAASANATSTCITRGSTAQLSRGTGRPAGSAWTVPAAGRSTLWSTALPGRLQRALDANHQSWSALHRQKIRQASAIHQDTGPPGHDSEDTTTLSAQLPRSRRSAARRVRSTCLISRSTPRSRPRLRPVNGRRPADSTALPSRGPTSRTSALGRLGLEPLLGLAETHDDGESPGSMVVLAMSPS